MLNVIRDIGSIHCLFGKVVNIPFLYASEAVNLSRRLCLVNTDLAIKRDNRVRLASNFDSPSGWRCFVLAVQREIVIELKEKAVPHCIGAHDTFETATNERNCPPGLFAPARTIFLPTLSIPTSHKRPGLNLTIRSSRSRCVRPSTCASHSELLSDLIGCTHGQDFSH